MKTLPILALLIGLNGCSIHSSHYSASDTASTTRAGATGRSEKEWWPITYCVRDGQAVLENEHVTLIYENLTRDQRHAFSFKNSPQRIQVSGAGQSTASVSCRRNLALVVFRSSYANGTNTLEFGGKIVRITDEGKTLWAGDKKIELNAERKLVYVKDGRLAAEH